MSLMDVVRAGVAIANKVTSAGGLQATVLQESFVSETVKGDKTYGAPTPRLALVTIKGQSVWTKEGALSYSRAELVFLDPTIVITDDDRFTLPDGTTTQPVNVITGFADPVTGAPILTQVFLG